MALIIRKDSFVLWYLGILFAAYIASMLQGSIGDVLRPIVTSASLLVMVPVITGRGRDRFPLRLLSIVGAVFIVYSVASLLFQKEKIYGIQNVIVFVCFYFGIRLAYSGAGCSIQKLDSIFMMAATISALVMTYSFLRYGMYSSAVFHERPMALFSVIMTCWASGLWGKRKKVVYLIITILLGVGVVASLSRTAALLYFLAVLMAMTLKPKYIASLAIVAICGWAAISGGGELGEAYHERFTKGEMVSVGGYDINTTGRTKVWDDVYTNWQESASSIVFGRGAGACSYLMTEFLEANAPHNEYLRILHDYGLVGFSLWIVFHTVIVKILWVEGAGVKESQGREHVRVARSMIAVYMISALVLNPMMFSFIAVPVSIYMGYALYIIKTGAVSVVNVRRRAPGL